MFAPTCSGSLPGPAPKLITFFFEMLLWLLILKFAIVLEDYDRKTELDTI